MLSVKEIRELCEEIVNSQSYSIKNIPININGRLTKTLGRVCYCGNKIEKIEFSKQFLATATSDSIYSVIQHEMAHVIATLETNERHGHDSLFKEVCKRIGCDNDKTKTSVERTVEEDKCYKYTVVCLKCKGKAYYNRKGKVISNLYQYHCGKCGGTLACIENLDFNKNF